MGYLRIPIWCMRMLWRNSGHKWNASAWCHHTPCSEDPPTGWRTPFGYSWDTRKSHWNPWATCWPLQPRRISIITGQTSANRRNRRKPYPELLASGISAWHYCCGWGGHRESNEIHCFTPPSWVEGIYIHTHLPPGYLSTRQHGLFLAWTSCQFFKSSVKEFPTITSCLSSSNCILSDLLFSCFHYPWTVHDLFSTTFGAHYPHCHLLLWLHRSKGFQLSAWLLFNISTLSLTASLFILIQ